MKIKELFEASPHKINALDVEPSDPRHPLYKSAIQDYTGSYSKGIANALHKMYRGKKFKVSDLTKEQIQMLDDIMYNHPLKQNMTVYHGLKENPWRIWKKYNVPTDKSVIVHLPAFTSTSTKISASENFAYHDTVRMNDKDYSFSSILKISVPAGTPGISVKKYSQFPNEDEILLSRGVNLQIMPNPFPRGYYRVWICKILSVTPTEHFDENIDLAEESEFQFIKAI